MELKVHSISLLLPDTEIILFELVGVWGYAALLFLLVWAAKRVSTTLRITSVRPWLIVWTILLAIGLSGALGIFPLFGASNLLPILGLLVISFVVMRRPPSNRFKLGLQSVLASGLLFLVLLTILESRKMLATFKPSPFFEFVLWDLLIKLLVPVFYVLELLGQKQLVFDFLRMAAPMTEWIGRIALPLLALISIAAADWLLLTFKSREPTTTKLRFNPVKRWLGALALISVATVVASSISKLEPIAPADSSFQPATPSNPKTFVLDPKAGNQLFELTKTERCPAKSVRISKNIAEIDFGAFSFVLQHKNTSSALKPLLISGTTAVIQNGNTSHECFEIALNAVKNVAQNLVWNEVGVPVQPNQTNQKRLNQPLLFVVFPDAHPNVIGVFLVLFATIFAGVLVSESNLRAHLAALGYGVSLSLMGLGHSGLSNLILPFFAAQGFVYLIKTSARLRGWRKILATFTFVILGLMSAESFYVLGGMGVLLSVLKLETFLPARLQTPSATFNTVSQGILGVLGITISSILVFYLVLPKPYLPPSRIDQVSVILLDRVPTARKAVELEQRICQQRNLRLARVHEVLHSCLSPLEGEDEWVFVAEEQLYGRFTLLLGGGITGTLWQTWARFGLDGCPRKFVLPNWVPLHKVFKGSIAALCVPNNGKR